MYVHVHTHVFISHIRQPLAET